MRRESTTEKLVLVTMFSFALLRDSQRIKVGNGALTSILGCQHRRLDNAVF